jgi:GNAT superfamily N-acetyltransferase
VGVRTATTSDFEAVDRVHTAAIRALAGTHYDVETIADWSGALDPDLFSRAIATTVYLVALSSGEVVGFAQLDVEAGEVRMLYVEPGWAGKGVGRQLLDELERTAREHGVERLGLRASLNAVPFYARCGWREVGPITHALRSGREVACVLMERELVEPE